MYVSQACILCGLVRVGCEPTQPSFPVSALRSRHPCLTVLAWHDFSIFSDFPFPFPTCIPPPPLFVSLTCSAALDRPSYGGSGALEPRASAGLPAMPSHSASPSLTVCELSPDLGKIGCLLLHVAFQRFGQANFPFISDMKSGAGCI